MVNQALSKLNGDWRNYALMLMGGALTTLSGVFFTGVNDHITRHTAESIIDQRLEPLKSVPDDVNEIKTDLRELKTIVRERTSREGGT